MSKTANKEQRRKIDELISELGLESDTSVIISTASNGRVFTAKCLTNFEAQNLIAGLNSTLNNHRQRLNAQQ